MGEKSRETESRDRLVRSREGKRTDRAKRRDKEYNPPGTREGGCQVPRRTSS